MARTKASERKRRAAAAASRVRTREWFRPGGAMNTLLRPYVALALARRANAVGLLRMAMQRYRGRQFWNPNHFPQMAGRRRFPVGTPMEAKIIADPQYINHRVYPWPGTPDREVLDRARFIMGARVAAYTRAHRVLRDPQNYD